VRSRSRNWRMPPLWIQSATGSFGDRPCAWRHPPRRISREHVDLDGRPDDRRYARRRHDGDGAAARRCSRARSLWKPPAGRRIGEAAKPGENDGAALGVALGFSFQVRHRPINPSVARPARGELRSFATPPRDGCALLGTIPTEILGIALLRSSRLVRATVGEARRSLDVRPSAFSGLRQALARP
jgi:hypothetical protein